MFKRKRLTLQNDVKLDELIVDSRQQPARDKRWLRLGLMASGWALLLLSSCYTELGTLGGKNSHARGINSRGMVVGYSYTNESGTPSHAFVYDPASKQMKDLGTAGGRGSGANDISDTGLIVGSASGDFEYPVTWDATTGAFRVLDKGVFAFAAATHVGRNGWIAGYAGATPSTDYYHRETVVWDPAGTLIRIGMLPGGTGTQTNGINSHGQVIGFTFGVEPWGSTYGFTWDPVHGLRAMPAGSGAFQYGAAPEMINDNGDIIGRMFPPGGSAGVAAWWRADTLERRTLPASFGSLGLITINNTGLVLANTGSPPQGVCASLSTGTVTPLHTGEVTDEFYMQREDRINDSGAITGTRGGRAALWDPGTCR
ncbi:MAG TPA: hypothetical protein VK524_00090 [Polyangiaceae bacterium]|nr:hypothetical protein [Polyangiaceae bacterium]